MADEKPIIIIKKKGGHAGHHGGAWKVAYADFMTAMMAFFLVMWLVNSADSATKTGIAKYFNDPGIFAENSGGSLLPGHTGILDRPFSVHNLPGGGGMAFEKSSKAEDSAKTDGEDGFFKSKGASPLKEGDEDIDSTEEEGEGGTNEKRNFTKLAHSINTQLVDIPELKNALGKFEIQVEADGLVMEIMDTEEYSMFESGSAVINPKAKEAFLRVAAQLVPFPNKIDILGHTDAHPYNSGLSGGYSNWELSTDRANAARRLLLEANIPEERIVGVIGRADKYPRVVDDPYAIANRRIAIKMRFGEERRIPVEEIKEKFSNTNTSNGADIGTSVNTHTSEETEGADVDINTAEANTATIESPAPTADIDGE